MTHLRIVSLSAILSGFLSSTLAFAQSTAPSVIDEKKPNILLIVDTSGSMEYKTGSNSYPTCTPGNPAGTNERSRWIEVLEVLTGDIDDADYSCEAVDRRSSVFRDEFAMPGGQSPPDYNYRNPYHRPLSRGCAITPDRSTVPTNAFDWVAPLQAPYPVNPASLGTCAQSFKQTQNGFIDVYNLQARFGLMTFDPLPDPGLGHSGSSTYTPVYAAGVEGAWSYYGSGSPASGYPADCDEDVTLEVGVRSGAAPASEGKMIYFGDPDSDDGEDSDRHDRLQSVLLATRPYGATPLNGALYDARNFFWEDGNLEPTTVTGSTLYNTTYLSPQYDDYVECGCREQHIILITDGEPNLDMRPECEAKGVEATPIDGKCPFDATPVEILTDLSKDRTNGTCSTPSAGAFRYPIITHVIGYSAEKYANNTLNCADLPTNSPTWADDTSGICVTNKALDPSVRDMELEVCCTLHELAEAGGSGRPPYIAPNMATLKTNLGDIMKEISAETGSATQPAPSPGVGLADATGAKAYRLLTSYKPDTGTSGLWGGVIERLRWTCDSSNIPTEDDKRPALGDDFGTNVATHMGDREFVSFIPNDGTATVSGDRSVRPWLATGVDDGAGAKDQGAQVTEQGEAFAALVPPEAMGLTAADPKCTTHFPAADATACATGVMKWTLGYDNGTGDHRCLNPADPDNCSVIGAVIHSTPTIVDRPTAPVEDESYTIFAEGEAETRPMIALVSSNDGFLHGFNLSPNSGATTTATDPVNTDANNEFFAFLPPAVLPGLVGQYPGPQANLLDGVAVVQDVVATLSSGRYLLERSAAGAKDPTATTWRTIMVQSFGGENSGYFAVDITNPRRPSTTGAGDPGPQFLWQLTKSDAADALFGTGGTPMITTVNLSGKEVAVAVLPGGRGGSPVAGTCLRANPTRGAAWDDTGFDLALTGAATTASYAPRSSVQCYSPTDVAARSLTVVRLDSGQILRTFRRNDPLLPEEVPGLPAAVFGASGDPYLDSPITGIPAAFPAGAGMVADRVFVGDQDGGLWRVDLSDTDPQAWTMELFFDAYAEHGALDGQSITSAPVLSVDDRGQITVNFATGAQDLAGGSSDVHYVYSLTEAEHPSDPGFYAKVNWVQNFTAGEHVVGPLTLYAGTLYFSTVEPATANVCSNAPGKIWGVDYLKPEQSTGPTPTDTPELGGRRRLQLDGSTAVAQYITVDSVTSGSGGSSIFGVSLEYVPSCAPAASTATGSLISGTRSAVTAPSSPALQLVFQGSGGQGDSLGFETSFQTVQLAAPRTASSILSWAAILE